MWLPCVGYVRKREGERTVHICVIKTVSMFKTSIFRLNRITGYKSTTSTFCLQWTRFSAFFFFIFSPSHVRSKLQIHSSPKGLREHDHILLSFVNNLRELFALPSCQVPLPSCFQHLMISKKINKKVKFSYIQQTRTDHTNTKAFYHGSGCRNDRFGQQPFSNSFQWSKVKSS